MMKERFFKKCILFSLLLIGFASCEKETRECPGSTEKNFEISGFNKIEAGETFHVDIKKGTNFSIKASGCTNDLDDLRLTLGNGNTLQIGYNKYRSDRYRVDFTITLPVLTAVNISGAAKAAINDFAGQQSIIRTVLSGTAECTLAGAGINTQIDLSGTSKLTVSGTTLDLYGNLSGAARLFGYELQSKEVDIDLAGTAKAYVAPQDKFFVSASGASHVFYKGNPAMQSINLSGAAKATKE